MRGRQAVWAALAAFIVVVGFCAPIALAQAEEAIKQEPVAKEVKMAIVLSVALVVGASCLGAGYAVARVGAAALGAASERPELLGRSLILVGLAEGIAIYGLIIGIMLIRLF